MGGDEKCKSRQVGGDEKAIEVLEYRVLAAALGKSRQVSASLGKWADTSKSWIPRLSAAEALG